MDRVSTDHPRVLVVTGMSGAGRSSTAKILEDLGYIVIDNLPPKLLHQAIQHHDILERHRHLAVVIDSRGGLPLDDLRSAITELARDGISTRIVFLDAEDSVIIRRYEENRRPHPLGHELITDAIAQEREMLAELREIADVIVDTSNLNVPELKERLETEFREDEMTRPMRVSIRSFGFKHGAPRDTDILFDVRFLPNPHWVPELRPLDGTHPSVSEYVLGESGAKEFLDKVAELLMFLIPRFEAEGKSYLSIGIGCTGGRHRGVAIAEELGRRIADEGIRAVVRHRDVDR